MQFFSNFIAYQRRYIYISKVPELEAKVSTEENPVLERCFGFLLCTGIKGEQARAKGDEQQFSKHDSVSFMQI